MKKLRKTETKLKLILKNILQLKSHWSKQPQRALGWHWHWSHWVGADTGHTGSGL